MNFTEALDHVLKHEGGFVDHPKDPGGMTNLGVYPRSL
jgi:lysozyme family protein